MINVKWQPIDVFGILIVHLLFLSCCCCIVFVNIAFRWKKNVVWSRRWDIELIREYSLLKVINLKSRLLAPFCSLMVLSRSIWCIIILRASACIETYWFMPWCLVSFIDRSLVVSYRCLLNVNESRQHIHYHDTYVSSTDTEHDVFLSFTGVMLVLKTLYCTTLVILSDTYGYYCI